MRAYSMGTLKPGATYIYEKANGITYAREVGSLERFEIGRDFDRKLQDELDMWAHVIAASKTNPTLQKALDRAIMIYKLSKDNP